MKFFTCLIIVLIIFILHPSLVLAGCNPPTDYSGCTIAKTGPKIAGNIGAQNYEQIRQLYNQENPSLANQQIPVTIIYTTQDLSPGNASQTAENLRALQQYGLQPVIRISSSVLGMEGWDRITPQESQQSAQVLNQLFSSVHFSVKPVVYFGNEPNLDGEWGGTKDAASFASSFAAFIQSAGQNRNFQLFAPPVATHQGGVEYAFMQQILDKKLANGQTISQSIDGVALTMYNDNPQSLIALYQELTSFYQKNNINDFIISEIGPLNNGKLLQNPGEEGLWADKMAAVFQEMVKNPSLFGDAQFISTSFFLDNDGDGNPNITLLVIIGKDGSIKIYDLKSFGGGLLVVSGNKSGCPTDEKTSPLAETKAESYVVAVKRCFLQTKEQVANEALEAVMQIKDFQFPDNQKLTTNLNKSADILKLADAKPKIVKKTTQGKITFEACEEGTTTWFEVPRDKIITFQTPIQMSQQDSVGQELVGMLNPAGGMVKGENTTNTGLEQTTPQQFTEEPKDNPCGYKVDAGIEILGQEDGRINYKLWVCRNEAAADGTVGDVGIRRFIGGVEVGYHMENLWGQDANHPDGGQQCLEYYPGDGGEQFMPTASSVEELNQTYWRVGNLQHNEGCADNLVVTATNKPPPPMPPPPPRKCETYNAKGLKITPKNICSGGSCLIKNIGVSNNAAADAISQAQAAIANIQQAGANAQDAFNAVLEKFGLCNTINIVITAKISTPYGATTDSKLRQKTLPVLNTGPIFTLDHAKQNMVEQFTASPTQEKTVETEIYGQAGIKNAYDKIQDQLRPAAN